ncbi:galactarate dehydratase [bacterium]|nr:galactarate dehydratase [bacterium]
MNGNETGAFTPKLDNVAIAVAEGGIALGTRLEGGIVTLESVPQGHKVALVDLKPGDAILRYGQVIGYAARLLPRGSWIEESAVVLPKAPDVDEIDALPFSPPARDLAFEASLDRELAGLSGIRFEGYRNPDGSVGSRNMLGIVPSVQCVAGVLNIAAAKIEKELLPKYPHVDGVAALNHGYGCGVAIDAPNAEIPIRTLRNLARHPNFGGEALIVGLGCEKLAPERIAPSCAGCQGRAAVGGGAAAAPAGASDIVILQEQAGFAGMIATLMAEAEKRLERLEARRREAIPLSELVIGVQCGGSDAFSGVTANPAIGYAADLLARAGATVMFSEVTEVRDGIHLLAARAADPEVRRRLLEEMRWYDVYLANGGVDRSANPTPGNKKGGLANIVEKALGSIAKSGRGVIEGVLSPGERSYEHGEGRRMKGIVFAATPASDFVCGTEQLASGIVLQVFSTGRGTPYGLAMAPVIKIASRSAIAKSWPDLFDLDAGKIATGDSTIEELGKELFAMILDAASGRYEPWADRHGIANDLVVFNPAPIT